MTTPANQSGHAFDDFSEAYEAMIDWPRRLANESPFFRKLCDRYQAKRVLDVACGTGHHAALFASWGFEVEAADLSPVMIQRCRTIHATATSVNWVVRGFDQVTQGVGTFDLAMCIGNSLALAGDLATVQIVLRNLMAAVRPGGVIVIHLMNLWRLPDGLCQWQKCQQAKLSGEDCLILKGVHRSGERGFVDLIVTNLGGLPTTMRSECVPLLSLTADGLRAMCQAAGASEIQVFGDYKQSAYVPTTSPDSIVVAQKA